MSLEALLVTKWASNGNVQLTDCRKCASANTAEFSSHSFTL